MAAIDLLHYIQLKPHHARIRFHHNIDYTFVIVDPGTTQASITDNRWFQALSSGVAKIAVYCHRATGVTAAHRMGSHVKSVNAGLAVYMWSVNQVQTLAEAGKYLGGYLLYTFDINVQNVSSFVPVSDVQITSYPSGYRFRVGGGQANNTWGWQVVPSNATNKTVDWRIIDVNGPEADPASLSLIYRSGGTGSAYLNVFRACTLTVEATVADGLYIGYPFRRLFMWGADETA